MLKKNRLMISILICILLIQPVYAASGTIELPSSNSVKEYTYYKVFDVTSENKVGWRRVWCVDGYEGCPFECDLVFYGANPENGKGRRDDEAELLTNHQASLVGIDNRHARTSTYQCVDDERTSMDGDLIWEDGKITISDDEEPTLHYFMYRGSPWINVVEKYSREENSGVSLKACNSPYNGGEIGLYLVTFDEAIFDEAKFENYLYNNIPSDALSAISTNSTIADVALGYYIVTAENTNGETEDVGNAKLTKDELQ